MIAVFEAWRLRQPGEIRRRLPGWDFDLGHRPEIWGSGWKGFVLVHRGTDGSIDGYARYHVEERWERRQPRNILHLDDLHALTDAAYEALWQSLAAMDWVSTIRAERRGPSERLPWLLRNPRAASIVESGDGLFVGLVDIPRALEARAYETSDRLSLAIVASTPEPTTIRVALDVDPDGARCVPTTGSPDLTIHASAVGAAYLGGTRLRDAVLADGVDEHTTGALERADRLFRTADEPWCSTFF
jgi:predicted acetyltransferase